MNSSEVVSYDEAKSFVWEGIWANDLEGEGSMFRDKSVCWMDYKLHKVWFN